MTGATSTEPINLEQVKAGYKRVDRLRDSADAAARICAESMLDGDSDTARRFAERYHNHVAAADKLRAELGAAISAKYGVLS